MFQYDKHILHCVLGSVSSNSHNSMFPTSRIIFFDSGLKGLNDWFCCRSFWRACRAGRFSIFWINSRTLVLCAYFTTECGSPGIRKSMPASFTIIGSWFSSWIAMDFPLFYEVLHHQRWAYRLHDILESRLVLQLYDEQQQVAPFCHESAQHWDSSCLQIQQVAPFCLKN